VQLAVDAGAEVTGVCSGDKAGFVESLGAARVLDYARTEIGEETEAYDAVVDIGGHRPLSVLRGVMRPGGAVVIVGSETGGRWTGGLGRSVRAAMLSPFVTGRMVMLVSREHHAGVDRIVERLAAGTVRAPLDRTFPLERAADAMRLLESGQVRGKVAVVP
jgi:NADPH:quinone reductase-like Zn-dependent oxidoreductase